MSKGFIVLGHTCEFFKDEEELILVINMKDALLLLFSFLFFVMF